MSHWNYRIIKHEDYTGIHEVHYDGDKKPCSWSEWPARICCQPDEHIGVIWDMFAEAFDRNVLVERDGKLTPDLAMCGHASCKLRDTCYRNAASGTRPSDHQCYGDFEPDDTGDCLWYWRTRDTRISNTEE